MSTTLGFRHPTLIKKNLTPNRFHLEPDMINGQDKRDPGLTFNLNFNRTSLCRGEVREPSPSTSSHHSPQACFNPSHPHDLESLHTSLNQWQFPHDLPIPPREIRWGPYAHPSSHQPINHLTSLTHSPQHLQPNHFLPSPISLKRPRHHLSITDDLSHQPPKRGRRHLSTCSSDASSEPLSPTQAANPSDRFEQAFCLLQHLTPHLEPRPAYSLEYQGSLHLSSPHSSNLSPTSTPLRTTYPPRSSAPLRNPFRTPSPPSNSHTYQTFSWYRPTYSNHPSPLWDRSPTS